MQTTIDQTQLDAAKDAVQRAASKYQTEKSALFTHDGKTAINAPAVHDREMQRIAEPLTAAVERAVGVADKVAAQVEALRVQPYADPTSQLSAVDLDDANRRARFVREDCESLALGDLAERLRWVQGNGSKSLQWLYARYSVARWQAEERKEPQDASLGDFGAALRDAGIIGVNRGLSREAVALGEAAGRLRAWARGQLQAASGNGTGRKMSL